MFFSLGHYLISRIAIELVYSIVRFNEESASSPVGEQAIGGACESVMHTLCTPISEVREVAIQGTPCFEPSSRPAYFAFPLAALRRGALPSPGPQVAELQRRLEAARRRTDKVSLAA